MADDNAPWRKFRYPLSDSLTDASINKREELDHMLARLNLAGQEMRPSTFGGLFNSPTNEPLTYERLATHVPPDVPKNTRILAFLGIGQDTALPDTDGWFLSDFFAFYHLFQGLTPHQTWLHALDLESLLESCKRYLHGSPYGKRKVVLDAKILQKIKDGKSHPLTRVKHCSLWIKVQAFLKEHLKEASKNKQNLLVMIFGHGEKGTYDFGVGNSGRNLCVKHFLKKIDTAKDVPIMLVSDKQYFQGKSQKY